MLFPNKERVLSKHDGLPEQPELSDSECDDTETEDTTLGAKNQKSQSTAKTAKATIVPLEQKLHETTGLPRWDIMKVLRDLEQRAVRELRETGTWEFLDLANFSVTRVPPRKRSRGFMKVHIKGTKRLRMLLDREPVHSAGRATGPTRAALFTRGPQAPFGRVTISHVSLAMVAQSASKRATDVNLATGGQRRDSHTISHVACVRACRHTIIHVISCCLRHGGSIGV